jgi:hypothetical protein
MDEDTLRHWLAKPRTELITAIVDGIGEQGATLHGEEGEFYAYALLPGEPPDIGNLVGVSNTEANIKVASTEGQYHYYRYCVEEWEHWHQGGFTAANRLLTELNTEFESLHAKVKAKAKQNLPPAPNPNPFYPASLDEFRLDEFQIAYGDSLLEAMIAGLEAAKARGLFGDAEKFLVVWISDSDDPVIFNSVRWLNSEHVALEFMKEFKPELE